MAEENGRGQMIKISGRGQGTERGGALLEARKGKKGGPVTCEMEVGRDQMPEMRPSQTPRERSVGASSLKTTPPLRGAGPDA